MEVMLTTESHLPLRMMEALSEDKSSPSDAVIFFGLSLTLGVAHQFLKAI